jgi:beta-glucosidase-like glycosyl hydrolase
MTSLKNLFRVQMRLGMFDPDAAQPFRSYGLEKVDTPEHRELTLDAARQGMTLVKNENKALPLAKKTNLGIALVGPNAVSTHRATIHLHTYAALRALIDMSALCFRTVDAESISRRAAEILLSDRLHLF